MSSASFHYKKRKKWSTDDMAAAVVAIRKKTMGYAKAAKLFNVPKTTLHKLCSEKDASTEYLISKKIGRKPVFDEKFEKLLVKYALIMNENLYRLSRTDLRSLAYQLAVKMNVPHPFQKGIAGRDWLKSFLTRNKQILPILRPFARARGLIKDTVDEFYDNLEETYDETIFTDNRIFNVDATGLSIVSSKIPKINARRGEVQLGTMTPAERDYLLTIVTCMSPAGIFVPPMIIFPQKNMNEILMKGAPVGSIGRAHPSGWIQTNLFTQWFQHFVDFVKPTQASPVLLLLDGQYRHTKNIELVDMSRENYVTIISLPPCCTHKIQPIERSFMGPLKTCYTDEVRCRMRKNEIPMLPYELTELLGKAYRECQTEEIAAKGFSLSGIYPFNRHVFTAEDYLATHQGSSDDIP